LSLTEQPTEETVMTDAIDRRTAGAAVAAGVLMFVSVAAELRRPVQDADGAVTDVPGFVFYVTTWTLGAAALLWAVHGLGRPGSVAGRIGRGANLAGAALLTAFGVVGLVTALVAGAPAEWSFLLFAVGLLLLALGAVPLALGLRARAPGWWTALLLAGAGAAVALLAEGDPWHDLGLFAFDAGWVALGLGLLARRAPDAADLGAEPSPVGPDRSNLPAGL
jgi:hypothetical protein